ncbi:MAG: Asp-tRNA(Asn)/Glu-tRNA(Gln) amidotransferase subunit GatC [Candidatus Acidiferrales bacterium]
MKITRDDVLYVAELAHLELSEAEVDLYRYQLDSILTYIEKLKELHVDDVEPMAQVLFDSASAGSGPNRQAGNSSDQDSNPSLRDDVLLPCTVGEAVLSGAPDASKPYFRVPRVIGR